MYILKCISLKNCIFCMVFTLLKRFLNDLLTNLLQVTNLLFIIGLQGFREFSRLTILIQAQKLYEKNLKSHLFLYALSSQCIYSNRSAPVSTHIFPIYLKKKNVCYISSFTLYPCQKLFCIGDKFKYKYFFLVFKKSESGDIEQVCGMQIRKII